LQFHAFDESYLERLCSGDFRTESHFAALRGDRKVKQPERLGAFVNSVCNNVLLEHYRASSRENSIEDEERTDFPDPSLDVVAILTHKEMEHKVRQVLEELSERDRRLLQEIFLEERDKDAVCQDFGVDRNYLRVLLHRAKQAFKAVYLKNLPSGIKGTAAG
jgi:RNA polymerase sigma-70 factor (ECF subfamily)